MGFQRFDLDAIGAGLVVAQAREEIAEAVASGAAVITAPPGTGKTTFVPPLVASLIGARAVPAAPADPAAPSGPRKPADAADPAASAGPAAPATDATSAAESGSGSSRVLRTLVTQPRRVAVRAAANRISALGGTPLGGPVGYTVRGDRRVGRDTVLEALTPGVLLRRLLADPELGGVGAVILDEVHERSIDGDLLLGMLAEVRELRPDLTLVAMSATLDAAAIAELLGGAPVVAVPSALHPLRIEYAAPRGARLDERGVTRGYLDHVARTAASAREREGCDALVFVPGAREVDETAALIREHAGAGVEVLPLHGRLPAREQDRAVAGRAAGEPPRIVVSTSLAESSLTVPGVRLVIDAGLSREVRRDRGRDMTGLVTVSASRDSAEQRAGRAARQGPGVAIRAYSETDLARMPRSAQPEILSADLSDAALTLAEWGTPGGAGLALLTPPPAASMRLAEEVLRALGLVDATGGATKLGSRVALLPVGVREARALIEGAVALGDARTAAEVVAAASGDHREPSADADALLRSLRSGRSPGAARWRGEVDRLAAIAESEAPELAAGGGTGTVARGPAEQTPAQQTRTQQTPVQHAAAENAPASVPATERTGLVLALARPEWIARRTGGGSRSYLLASGTRAAVPEGSQLATHEWIAVREVQRAAGAAADGTGAVIRLAAGISEEAALAAGASLVTSGRTAGIADGRVRVREERRLGAITLASAPAAATPADTGPAYAAHLAEHGLDALPWSEAAAELRARLGLLHRELGDPWPAMSDAALLDRLADWLSDDLARLRQDSGLRALDVTSALRRLLPWPEAARLDELAPERLAVPSGSRVRIAYPAVDEEDGRPVVAVKLQEMFGFAETPRVVEGRVPILFHLLSPAGRPLAVTDDLASFWNGPYREVRREMRGRYPKHPWPEDPWTAQATARTKRAAGR